MSFFSQYDAQLTTTERGLVGRARRFCAGAFSASVHEAYLRGEPFPREWISEWAALGMLGLQAKAEHGGHEASFLCKVRVAQEMARHGFAAAFCLNNLQGQVTRTSLHGSDEQRRHLLQPMLAGAILAAPAMTEPGGGSDLGALATTARRVEGGWSISGTKSWVTNGAIVDGIRVLARVEESGELATFFVPCGSEASAKRHEIVLPGARSFRLAALELRDHVVPCWSLLSKPGEALRAAMESVNAARVHVAAMAVASLHAALYEATRYCSSRQAFGKPVLAHQGLQWELAEVSIRLEAANALVFKAAQLVNDRLPAVTAAAQCKKFAVDTAIWGIDQCMRAMGATGASGAHRLGMQLAEVRLAAFGDGTNEIMLDRIGRSAAFGRREPSVVTRSTRGVVGQRARRARSTRAVVDLPAATDPPMPMTNGTLASAPPGKRRRARNSPCAASTCIARRRESGRYTSSTPARSRRSPIVRRWTTSSSASAIGVPLRRRAHSVREKVRKGEGPPVMVRGRGWPRRR